MRRARRLEGKLLCVAASASMSPLVVSEDLVLGEKRSSVDDLDGAGAAIRMRAHQVFHPDRFDGYARLFPVLLMVHDDDFVERNAASILAAAVLARAEQLALMLEDGAATASVSDVGRNRIRRMRRPGSVKRRGRVEPKLGGSAAWLLKRHKEPVHAVLDPYRGVNGEAPEQLPLELPQVGETGAAVQLDRAGRYGFRDHVPGAAVAKNARVGEVIGPLEDSQRRAQPAVTHFRARDFSKLSGVIEIFKVDPVLAVRLDDEGVRIKVVFGRVNPMKAAHFRLRDRIRNRPRTHANRNPPMLDHRPPYKPPQGLADQQRH